MSTRSTDKLHALVAILGKLDGGQTITPKVLAETIGVTERTIYRYMMTLQQAGYPIYFDRDRMSYRFSDGFSLHYKANQPELFTALDLKSRMLRSSPIGLLSYDDRGQCIEANEAAVAIVGGSREQVLGQNYRELDSWKRSGLLLMAQKVMQSGTEQTGDFHLHTSYGRETWLHCTMSSFIRNSRPHLLLIVEDIQERMQIEEALRESEETLRLFVDNSPVYTFIKDENSRFVQASRGYEQLLGRPMSEVLGRDMRDIFPAEFAEQILRDDQTIWETWQKLEIDEELHGRFFRTIKFPFERHGKRYLAGFAVDISDRKRAELQLQEQAVRLRTLIETTLDAFWIVDGSGTIIEVNQRACELSGYSEQELVGMHLSRIEAIETPEEIAQHVQKIFTLGYDRFTTRHRCRNGEIIAVEASTALIPGSDKVMTFIRRLADHP